MVPTFFRTEGMPLGFVMIQQDAVTLNVRKSAITCVGFSPKAAMPLTVKMSCGTEFKGVATKQEVNEFLRVISTDAVWPNVKLGNPVEEEKPTPLVVPPAYFCGAACAHYMQITNMGPVVRHPFMSEYLRRVTNAKSADAALTALADCEASMADYLRAQIKAGEFSKRRYLNPVHILAQAQAVSFVCGVPDKDFKKFMHEDCMLAKEDTVVALLVARGYHAMATQILDQHVDYFLTYV